jgi:hypothetical protein
MLSQKEIEYLRTPENFDVEYRKALRHRIRSKVHSLREEILLLENAGYKVTENRNAVTEFNNPKTSSKQASFKNLLVGLPGFEPESIEPKSTSLDQASREPRRFAENIISTEP